MSAKIKLIAAALWASIAASGFSQSNFMPAKVPGEPGRAALLTGGGGLALVEAEVDGIKCLLIFDTGATHTTFDSTFIKANFPAKKLEKVILGGTTNVEASPELTHIEKLKIGEAEFCEFDIMALDLSAFAGSVGRKIDGVLGMNVIGATRTLVSLGGGEIIFCAAKEQREGFEPARRFALYDPLTLTLAVAPMGEKAGAPARPLIIDSGSSFTFLDEGFGWPESGEAHEIGARDVNGRGVLASKAGVSGELEFVDGGKIRLKPLISKEPLNRIGGDTLRRYDILIEPRCIGFRARETAERKGK